MNSYFDLCEEIYSQFKFGNLKINPKLQRLFDIEYVPEPFLEFPRSSNPEHGYGNYLHVITTNPGQGLTVQLRNSRLLQSTNYKETAAMLIDYYRKTFPKNPKTKNALRRIDRMIQLACEADYEGVIQLEIIPWHSSELPDKSRLPILIETCAITNNYIQALRTYLADKSVITIDALSSRRPLSKQSFETPWLQFKKRIVGFEKADGKLDPIVKNQKGITAAILVAQTDRSIKALFGMQGSNNLPGAEGMKNLARAIKNSRA